MQDFLDEWLSAPYPQMQADRTVIFDGLAALEDVTRKRAAVAFAAAGSSEQTRTSDWGCDDELTQPFARGLIELVCAGYYTTREGHAASGYVGNMALDRFAAPNPEVEDLPNTHKST